MKPKTFGITKFVRDLVCGGTIDIKTVWSLVEKEFPSATLDSTRTILWEERRRANIPTPKRAGLLSAVREVLSDKRIKTFEKLREELDKRGVPVNNMETLRCYFLELKK